jgi:hypothetical protein
MPKNEFALTDKYTSKSTHKVSGSLDLEERIWKKPSELQGSLRTMIEPIFSWTFSLTMRMMDMTCSNVAVRIEMQPQIILQNTDWSPAPYHLKMEACKVSVKSPQYYLSNAGDAHQTPACYLELSGPEKNLWTTPRRQTHNMQWSSKTSVTDVKKVSAWNS